MTCPCGIDHWHWVISGFQGIAGMMEALDREGMPISKRALGQLEEQVARLMVQVERQREQSKQPILKGQTDEPGT